MVQKKQKAEAAPAAMWTTEEVAHYLKVTRRAVQQWIKTGKLKALRIGREFRIEAQELEAFKERARQAVNRVEERS
jgi:putative molybdopterin biosynthesis protein